VHKGEVVGDPDDFAMSGGFTIDNHLHLDGKEIYRNQKEYKEDDLYRNSGSSSGGGYGR